ncbi:MAG: hypothetical protein QM802_26870 [Agriterribacter sp.]
MLIKLRSQVFIDTLVFELNEVTDFSLNAILSDENGNICNHLQTTVPDNHKVYYWGGFNDLPYGIYTLEMFSDEKKKVKMNLVKRV